MDFNTTNDTYLYPLCEEAGYTSVSKLTGGVRGNTPKLEVTHLPRKQIAVPRRPHAPSQRHHRVVTAINRRTSNRRAETQRLLLDAGRRIIARHGVGGASVNLITAEVGFSRGAFYSNFIDMDHFVRLIAFHEWQRILTHGINALHTLFPQTEAPAPETLTELIAGRPPRTDENPTQPSGMSNGDIDPEGVAQALHATLDFLIETSVASDDGEAATPAALPTPEFAASFPDDTPRSILAALELIATTIQALPQDPESVMLRGQLDVYIVGLEDPAHPTRQALHRFRQGLELFWGATLERMGVRTTISTMDFIDLFIALAGRTSRNRMLIHAWQEAPKTSSNDFLAALLPALRTFLVTD